jgi:stalled ribosome rescue protein Dom34
MFLNNDSTTEEFVSSITEDKGSVYIGSRNGGSEFLNGAITEILIYDRLLTSEEMSTIKTYSGVV